MAARFIILPFLLAVEGPALAKTAHCPTSAMGTFIGGEHAQVYATIERSGRLTKAKFPCPRDSAEALLDPPAQILGSFQGKVCSFEAQKIYVSECGDTYEVCLTPDCKLRHENPGLAEIFIGKTDGMSLVNAVTEKPPSALPEKRWQALETETRSRRLNPGNKKVKPAEPAKRKLLHIDLPKARDVFFAEVTIEDRIPDPYGQTRTAHGFQFVSSSQGALHAPVVGYGSGPGGLLRESRLLTARFHGTTVVVWPGRYGATVFSLSESGKLISSIETSNGQAECD